MTKSVKKTISLLLSDIVMTSCICMPTFAAGDTEKAYESEQSVTRIDDREQPYYRYAFTTPAEESFTVYNDLPYYRVWVSNTGSIDINVIVRNPSGKTVMSTTVKPGMQTPTSQAVKGTPGDYTIELRGKDNSHSAKGLLSVRCDDYAFMSLIADDMTTSGIPFSTPFEIW